MRFRKAQRLTLKRSVSLDLALTFASQVRGERFHNPDDVFIIDDASGETISELYLTPEPVIKTIPEAPPPEAPSSQQDGKSGLEELPSIYGGRRQLRHLQTTVRGGMRLISTVNRSLGQLDRLMGILLSAKLPGSKVEQLISDTRSAIEQVQKVHDGLSQIAPQVFVPDGEEMVEPSGASLEEGTEMLLSAGAGSRMR